MVTTVVAALIAVVAAVAWVGVRGWLAKTELEQVVAERGALAEAFAARNEDAVSAALARVRTHAAAAADLTSDPVWWVAEAVLFAGANAAAVRATAESVRDVALAGESVVHALQGMGREGGGAGLDLSRLTDLTSPVAAASAAVHAADEKLDAIDVDALIGPLRGGVEKLRDAVSSAAPALSDAAALSGILPGMLGADGDRTILIMVQNPAEVRTGGGITGSFIEITAARARLSVGLHADSSEFPRSATPLVDLPPALTDLYGDVPGTSVINATMTTDFDLSARLASAWWQRLGRAAPDAVISIDPLVLQALLRITGPVTLTDGSTVDADNATARVLVDPYLTRRQDGQTALQTDLAQGLFAQLLSTPLDLAAWAGELSTPIAEGRVSIWSAHPAEQEALVDGPFAGQLARYRAAGANAVGVYFNDATTGKMGTFLDTRIGVGTRTCRTDGVVEVAISVTMRNTAPADARGFPISMAGAANPGLPGDITTDVAVAVPGGWLSGGVELDGRQASSYDLASKTSPTSLTRVVLVPGQASTATFHFLAKGDAAKLRPAIVHTPMMNDVRVGEPVALPCG